MLYDVDTMKPKIYFTELESLRGIAAVLVALFHIRHWHILKNLPGLNNYNYLVDFFFVLSGFVISYNFSNSINNWSNFKIYIIKRFFRLYPLFLITSLPFFAFSIMKTFYGMTSFQSITTFDIRDFVFYILLIYKWGFVVDIPFNYPSWSISVELFLYILSGLTFMITTIRNSRILISILVSLISLGILLFFSHTLDSIGSFAIFRGLYSFSLGNLIYLFFLNTKKQYPFNNISKTVWLLLTTISVCFVFYNIHSFPYMTFILPILWALIIYSIITNIFPGFVISLLNLRYVERIGKVSYSFYLTHAIMISLVEKILRKSRLESNGLLGIIGLILLLSSTFVLSLLTYKFIEVPGKNLYKRFLRVDTG